jgi:rSAM/selenodomain-associated transferase 2
MGATAASLSRGPCYGLSMTFAVNPLEARLSVVIPTLDAAPMLEATLRNLQARPQDEIIVADGGSRDRTTSIAAAAGARVVAAPRGRGPQLAAGAAAATRDWLLFVHADTRLDTGWRDAVGDFMADPRRRAHAAAFRFALDDRSRAARRLERAVAWRCRCLHLPYGDQGLLIAAEHYRRVGGFKPLPIMEDVDLVRRIGRRNIVMLPVAAVTSAERWRRDGWMRRSARNLACLSLYVIGVPPRVIAALYR